ncbi:hypothetical protein [Polaribacter cellanae]|uniref:Uncharacterized protein n=1 Tax=Polaribacter cellanae TaxID=2818493 RepID=A0A975CU72_9FLAO|nr:hypothetical protein [Polaribacter cellanae]QTE23531.1 hypothetical protein J3359_04410 [Polaribacter cellanae]
MKLSIANAENNEGKYMYRNVTTNSSTYTMIDNCGTTIGFTSTYTQTECKGTGMTACTAGTSSLTPYIPEKINVKNEHIIIKCSENLIVL